MQNNLTDTGELVTVVTITYNAEAILEETILSVINQDYKNIEYIIIDGASTDKTIDIIKKYEEKIAYWTTEPDDGIYYAMNKGIEKATGEWINFMNAGDSFVDNDTIEKVINSLDEETELIYGDHVCDGVIGSVKGRKITRLIPCCHQSLFVKTALMKQSPYNTLYKISADYEFMLKMYQNGKKLQYIEEPIANYLTNGFSDQNQIRWYLEVLTLMMNNHVSLDEITKSPAYSLLVNHDQNKQLTIQNNHLKRDFEQIIQQLSVLSAIKTWKHPIEKVKAYKKLLFIYAQLKS